MWAVDIEFRACEQCGRDFFPRRSDARFCPGTAKCRVAAYRARRRAAAQAGSDRLDRLRQALQRVTNTQEQTS